MASYALRLNLTSYLFVLFCVCVRARQRVYLSIYFITCKLTMVFTFLSGCTLNGFVNTYIIS